VFRVIILWAPSLSKPIFSITDPRTLEFTFFLFRQRLCHTCGYVSSVSLRIFSKHLSFYVCLISDIPSTAPIILSFQ
jgi:hypothetical protein